MKFKKLALIVLAAIMVLTFTGCGEVKFLSNNQVKDLTDTYGTPQMQMTVEYVRNEKVVELTLTYDLLLDKAPITVVNFINLVNDGFYNAQEGEEGAVTSMVFDGRISSSTNAWVVGRYTLTTKGTAKTYALAPELDYTLKGEFVQNGWELPVAEGETDEEVTDSNAKIEMFSLAMYHQNKVENFDDASSAFFLTTSSTQMENYKNYAVFAKLATISVAVDGTNVVTDATEVPSMVLDDFNSMTGTTSKTITVDEEGTTETRSVLSNVIRIVEAKMLGTTDYSALPRDYVIQK
ncbi:MAG: peptidylprolyl isomerase [Clostridia bacterium]|nr:peptidylprolyl isomerase [Clostridia bacterium]